MPRKSNQEKEKERLFEVIEGLASRAKKLEEDYEKAIKNGNLLPESPYPQIEKIFDKIDEEILSSDAWGFDSDCNYQYVEASYFHIWEEYQKKWEEDKKRRKISETISSTGAPCPDDPPGTIPLRCLVCKKKLDTVYYACDCYALYHFRCARSLAGTGGRCIQCGCTFRSLPPIDDEET